MKENKIQMTKKESLSKIDDKFNELIINIYSKYNANKTSIYEVIKMNLIYTI